MSSRGAARKIERASVDARVALAKSRTNLAELVMQRAADVKLVRKGKLYVGLCPFHGEKSPSFIVDPKDQHFHCFACGAHGDAISFLCRHDRLSFFESLEVLEGGAAPPLQPARPPAPAADDTVERLAIARRIWDEAVPTRPGDLVRRYLAGRGIQFPELPASLRFHGDLRHPIAARNYPAMVAAITRGADLVGVHCTYFEPAASGELVRKAAIDEAKIIRGVPAGGAVRLTLPGEDPEPADLGLAEGIESALSARLIFNIPTWSCLNATLLAGVAVPFGVARVYIFADRDRPRVDPEKKINMPEGAGLYWARRLQARMQGERRAARVVLPALAGDKNDFSDQLVAMLNGGKR